MIRVADLIANFLADQGIHHIFMLTGGGAMHLNDAFGREERLHVICNHHEQACAMAAEGYARVTGNIGVINVTTGPGGINALNGVYGAFMDSIPMLIVSGQVKRETYIGSYNIPGLRQLGDQEVDIVRMAEGITKYAVTVYEPKTILYHMQKALHLAKSGRPGPCWLDIPIDVQSSLVDPDELEAFIPESVTSGLSEQEVTQYCQVVLDRIQNARRPVILAGSGVRHAKAIAEFNDIIEKLQIPVTTAWTHDIIDSRHPLFCGRPGTIGDRAGNFVVQNSDALLILGSRLNIRQVSYNWRSFARYAYKIQVDIDPAELQKPTVQPDLGINCDVGLFLTALRRLIDEKGWNSGDHQEWLRWCQQRRKNYFGYQAGSYENRDKINPYLFFDQLFKKLNSEDVIVCGNATATIVPFQTAHLQLGQLLISNSGAASMGYDLPAAVGAAVARSGQRVICLAGDGSLHLNIQELQTVVHHKLPLKIFVLNNDGYLSIRTSQSNFFDRLVGEGPTSGVSLPDYVKVAQAYGLPAMTLERDGLELKLESILNEPGAVLVNVLLDSQQTFEPKLSSKKLADGRMISAPLEDMAPFLPRGEFYDNLFIPAWDQEY